jgi:serine protease Do
LTIGLFGAAAPVAADDPKPAEIKLPAAFDKPAPENVEDLKAIQQQVKKVLEKVIPCTVGVRIGAAQGSGVIVSKDGYVLTAGHVSGTPGRDCTLVFQDGKTVKAKTLGANRGIDSGMIKIVEEKEWPFLEMGKSADLKPGQWVIATGHPGGFKTGRSPVVRLGRILSNNKSSVTTDCTLVGGDSGGPLFDMYGKVIGIHSRIGMTITSNVHVPVDTYRETWDALVKGEELNGSNPNQPYLGVQGDPDAKDCTITEVLQGSPAEKAGIKPKDIVTMFDGQKIEKFDDLGNLIRKKKPGDEVAVDILRGEEKLTLKVKLGKRVTP